MYYEPEPKDQNQPRPDRLVNWLRFVCGAILGLFADVRLYFTIFDRPVLFFILAVGLVLVCGLGAAKYGDRFWSALFDRR
jgi:hypothetical protein